jgi:hypothetical protein
MEKFQIRPFRQKNGYFERICHILAKRLYRETRMFQQKPSIQQKGLIYHV